MIMLSLEAPTHHLSTPQISLVNMAATLPFNCVLVCSVLCGVYFTTCVACGHLCWSSFVYATQHLWCWALMARGNVRWWAVGREKPRTLASNGTTTVTTDTARGTYCTPVPAWKIQPCNITNKYKYRTIQNTWDFPFILHPCFILLFTI